MARLATSEELAQVGRLITAGALQEAHTRRIEEMTDEEFQRYQDEQITKIERRLGMGK